MSLKDIGQSIRDARKTKGDSLQKVADALGMSINTLSLLERGDVEELGVRKMLRVMNYVGLDLVARPRGFGMTLEDALSENQTVFHANKPGQKS